MIDFKNTSPEEGFFWHMSIYSRAPSLINSEGSLADVLLNINRSRNSDLQSVEGLSKTVITRLEEALRFFRDMKVEIPPYSLQRYEKDIALALCSVSHVAIVSSMIDSRENITYLMIMIANILSALTVHLLNSDFEAPWSDVSNILRSDGYNSDDP